MGTAGAGRKATGTRLRQRNSAGRAAGDPYDARVNGPIVLTSYESHPPMHLRSALLLTALLLACFAQAQKNDDDDREGFNGLRAGYYSSNLEGDWGDADARTGFYGGYYRNLIKVPLYRLSTGLEYHTSGATASAAGVESEPRLSYLSLAINNRFKIGPVYGDIGLDPALLLGEKALVNGTEVDIPSDQDAANFDVLVHVGAGFKFLFLGVEARYRYGLLDVYEGTRNTGLEVGLSAFF